MKTYVQVLFVLLLGVLLAACSLREDAASLYKQEHVLQIDIILPDPVVLHESQSYQARLEQNGSMVGDAQDVSFTFWKYGTPEQTEEIVARNEGNGIYSVEKALESDGLYFVKVHATANGSTVMPTKRFAVGELSPEEEASLQPEHQHHHGHDAHH